MKEMKSKVEKANSWKAFWLFECYLASLTAIVIIPFIHCNVLPGPKPAVGWAMTCGLLAAITGVSLGVVYRAISKRNDSLGFFFIIAIPPWATRNVAMPLAEVIPAWGCLLLCLILFIALIEVVQRAWTRSKSRPRSSPMADTEIDARPIA
jgi:hypothetical protein